MACPTNITLPLQSILLFRDVFGYVHKALLNLMYLLLAFYGRDHSILLAPWKVWWKTTGLNKSTVNFSHQNIILFLEEENISWVKDKENIKWANNFVTKWKTPTYIYSINIFDGVVIYFYFCVMAFKKLILLWGLPSHSSVFVSIFWTGDLVDFAVKMFSTIFCSSPPDFACSRKVESIPLAHQGQTSRAGQTPSAASFRVIAASVSISWSSFMLF